VRTRGLEFLPGFEATAWHGIAAPKQTPVDAINRLNREINAILDDPNVKSQIAELGGDPLPRSPAEFAKLIAADTEKWSKVIRVAGIRAG
jgi:tripartite-type tricarboxylate transporter receptor subunit TctC